MLSLTSKIVIYVLIVMDSTLILVSRRRWYIATFALLGTLTGFLIETTGVNLSLWRYGQSISILGVPPVIYIGWFFTMLLNGILIFFILNYIVDKKPLKYELIENTKGTIYIFFRFDFSFFKKVIKERYLYITLSIVLTWLIGCAIEFYGVNQHIWTYIPLGPEVLNVPLIVLLAWGIVMSVWTILFYYWLEIKIKNISKKELVAEK